MREAGKITAGALELAATLVKPGVSLIHIDSEIHRFITSHGATPSFLHYNGFPASACISVNDEVIHGIPGKRLLTEGDIVKVDVGACYKGYHGDAARTLFCGEVSEDAKRLNESHVRASLKESNMPIRRTVWAIFPMPSKSTSKTRASRWSRNLSVTVSVLICMKIPRFPITAEPAAAHACMRA